MENPRRPSTLLSSDPENSDRNTNKPPLCHSPAGITVDAQLSALDDEIAWHYAQISILKARRNSIAPISSLPNELLSHILTLHAVESNTLFNLKWTKAMLVCRHWHDLALAAHSLWAFIEVGWNHDSHRMSIQLARSGVAPLTLKIMADEFMSTRVILPHSERIFSIQLAGDAHYVVDFVRKLPQHSFPILRCLSLDAHWKGLEIPEGTTVAIADDVFDGGMPCLRELSLYSINLRWSSLRDLEVLSLTLCRDSASTAPTFDDLLDMLASSPQLKSLKLDGIIPLPTPEQEYRAIELSHLNHVHLGGHVNRCATLLAQLRFLPTTQMTLYPAPVRIGAELRNLLIPVRKHVRAAGAPTPRLLQIECHGASDSRILFLLTTIHHSTAPPNFLGNGGILSLISHPDDENAVRQIMVKLCKALPCEAITHIDARCATQPSETSWKAALRRLPALEMVYLQANVGATKMLRTLVAIERAAPAERGTYPRVRRIHLLAAMWERDAGLIEDILQHLEVFLRECHTLGTPVRVLEIEERDGCLQMGDDRWEGLFRLVGEQMIRDGAVYDPVKRREELARLK